MNEYSLDKYVPLIELLFNYNIFVLHHKHP